MLKKWMWMPSLVIALASVAQAESLDARTAMNQRGPNQMCARTAWAVVTGDREASMMDSIDCFRTNTPRSNGTNIPVDEASRTRTCIVKANDQAEAYFVQFNLRCTQQIGSATQLLEY